MLSALLSGTHYARNGSHHLVPFRLLSRKLPPPRHRESVILGAAIGFRLLPFRCEPSLPFEPVQRRIQGAMLQLQGILGFSAEGLADSVAVLGAPLQCPKNQHVQSPLQDFNPISIGFPLSHIL